MNADSYVKSIRSNKPLIHCISNIVTANDCANLLLALGASPIMAQAPEEMSEITVLADALVINTGTPDSAKFEAARRAGMAANKKGIPVTLDPVGAGASKWRLESINALLLDVKPSIIRANYGEVCALIGNELKEHGVDSETGTQQKALRVAQLLAKKYSCTVLLSGSDDIITDAEHAEIITGGSELMKQITGAGCMLSCLCAAFSTASNSFDAALTASHCWKETAKSAELHAAALGLGSYHEALFNCISKL